MNLNPRHSNFMQLKLQTLAGGWSFHNTIKAGTRSHESIDTAPENHRFQVVAHSCGAKQTHLQLPVLKVSPSFKGFSLTLTTQRKFLGKDGKVNFLRFYFDPKPFDMNQFFLPSDFLVQFEKKKRSVHLKGKKHMVLFMLCLLVIPIKFSFHQKKYV